jgi:molecular chaperone DnaJ
MDHYHTLNISPTASHEEIKKAFRRLALQYHPDKNTSPDAAMRFRQIQEAWQVLKDKRLRAAYNYRRYTQQPQQASKPLAQNIDELLAETNVLQRKTNALDPFRVDYDMVLYALKDSLSEHNLHVFKSSDQRDLQTQIFRNILGTTRILPFSLVKELAKQLTIIAAIDPEFQKELDHYLQQARWQYHWNRYKIWLALAIAVLFCTWLLFMGR